MLYHLSPSSKSLTLIPRVPENFFTEHGYEDNKIARVCFTPTIEQCLMALSYNLEGKIFYIHTPEKPLKDYKVISNSQVISKVPDAKITGETWILDKVKTKVIGCIKVTDSPDDGIPFTYGNGKYNAELYKWNYKKLPFKQVLAESSLFFNF